MTPSKTPLAKLMPRLRLPLIAAPMLRISGPALVAEVCRQGVVGAFPTANAASVSELDAWLTEIGSAIHTAPTDRDAAPWCPNLIMRRDPVVLRQEVDCLLRHGTEMVITSVGTPAPVVAPLHEGGCIVFADVATIAHARKALAAGADGLVLLTAGAGGQTGWLNGFAFARAVRSFFDGPLVLAGGISDGTALWAARVLGCDLGYMGTRFIATSESMANPAYRQMLVESSADDVVLTRAFTGLPTSMLRASIANAGLDPDCLDESTSPELAREIFGASRAHAERPGEAPRPRRWRDVWSAGHSVSAVENVLPVVELVAQLEQEYRASRRQALSIL